jgi:hypothetical protein
MDRISRAGQGAQSRTRCTLGIDSRACVAAVSPTTAIQANIGLRAGGFMPLGLIARLRRYRRPAILIAAGLIAVQAFMAGLTTAQALVLTSNPAAVADFPVICHGNGGSGSDNGKSPDPAGNQHPCCVACAAGATPATLPEQLIVLNADRCRVFKSPFFCAASIRITPRAVRAGASQAPPSLD